MTRGAPTLTDVEGPEVRYARSGDVSIAYGVVGEGPFDLVFIGGSIFSSLDVAWDGPPAAFFRRLASFSRLILLDKRGTGLSDRVAGLPDLETRMDDVRAVMDAVGSQRAAIMGVSEGGAMTILFAATYPERVAAMILYGTYASATRNEDFPDEETREDTIAGLRDYDKVWGTQQWLEGDLERYASSLAGDESIRRWWARLARTSSSPAAVVQFHLMNVDMDVRHALPTIRVPALILHTTGDALIPVAYSRLIADRIPGAQYVEIPGRDHIFWAKESEPVLDEAERFLTGIWKRGEWDVVEPDRMLATVLFTDIVDSTAKLAEMGDKRWKELIREHHALIRRHLVRFRGREIDTAGDGFFASFDGPARAIRCAVALIEAVRELGIEIRAGLHTGECEVVEGKIGGIAVHIGARVAGQAEAGEVLVSSTVKDLVAGSGIRFEERGTAELKGLPGEWHLWGVSPGGPA